uniref:Uncharacterized protein n=1 Tax=Spironucleus salmonicida TaxID=348837 RepID=V6LN14_9EUKA|eukprot:EST45613.1 hypothetical protein SS50377_14467 [Spironucleus salmonicida]
MLKNINQRLTKKKSCILIWIIVSLILLTGLIVSLIFIFTNIFKRQDNTKYFEDYKWSQKKLIVSQNVRTSFSYQDNIFSNHNYAFDRLVEFSLFHGFTEVTLFAGSVEWESLDFDRGRLPHEEDVLYALRKLRAKGIKASLAFYINDDINNMTSWQYSGKIAAIAKRINSADTPISMIHFDQEPDQAESYSALVQMLKLANDIFPTGTAVKPAWLRTPLSGISFPADIQAIIADESQVATLADLINRLTTNSQVMAYSNTWDDVQALAELMKQSAAKFGKSSTPILETSFGGNLPDTETLYQQVQGNQTKWYRDVTAFAAKHRSVVIHDYRHYYSNFLCSEPVIWKGVSQTRNCAAPVIPNSQAPDIEYDGL